MTEISSTQNGLKAQLSGSMLEAVLNAPLSSRAELVTYCITHGIPVQSNFMEHALPESISYADAQNTYMRQDQLPDIGIKHLDSGCVVAIESDQNNYHGQVCAAIAEMVGVSLFRDVNAMYIPRSINPNYRAKHEPEQHEAITQFMEQQGVSVFNTSIKWDNPDLDWKTFTKPHSMQLFPSFVVDSAGNNGDFKQTESHKPEKDHNIMNHLPPLHLSVGAAKFNDQTQRYEIEGYSSGNEPTLLAPVYPNVHLKWKHGDLSQPAIGTSAAAPYVSGILAALNQRYARYLPREYILYALCATANPVSQVAAFKGKSEQPREITYEDNAHHHAFNPELGGFGMVNVQLADKMLAHMVDRLQKDHSALSIPKEDFADLNITQVPEPDEQGRYTYRISMPAGQAMKTTLAVEFENEFGKVSLQSPQGTEYPTVLSQQPAKTKGGKKPPFGLSTTHAWLGEQMDGEWIIRSTKPIKHLRLSQNHFGADDKLLLQRSEVENTPYPNLSEAVSLAEILGHESARRLWVERVEDSPKVLIKSCNIDAICGSATSEGKHPIFDNHEKLQKLLSALPDGITERKRRFTDLRYNPNKAERDTYKLQGADYDGKFNGYSKAAGFYAKQREGESKDIVIRRLKIAEANALSMAAAFGLLDKAIALENDGKLAEDEQGCIAERAIPVLRKSIDLSKEMEHMDHAYRDLDRLYDATMRTVLYYRAKGDAAKAEEVKASLQDIRSEILQVNRAMQGKLDDKALRIEEGQIGFSSDQPIGTDNTGPCLTIVARHTQTGKVGLAHLNYEADPETLERFFAQFPPGRLKMRLVGSRFNTDERSIENLHNAFKVIRRHDVDIISAYVLSEDRGSSAVVVDPKTFQLFEHVPTLEDKNTAISNALPIFYEPDVKRELITQFDLTRSPLRAPILLDQFALSELRNDYIDVDETERTRIMRDKEFVDRGLVNHNLHGMIDEYNQAWQPLCEALESKIMDLGINEDLASGARQALKAHALYVGENADILNKPLLDAINDHLFEVNNGTITLHPEVMDNITFAYDGYEALMKQNGGHAAMQGAAKANGAGRQDNYRT